jgi:hypothetical protein
MKQSCHGKRTTPEVCPCDKASRLKITRRECFVDTSESSSERFQAQQLTSPGTTVRFAGDSASLRSA